MRRHDNILTTPFSRFSGSNDADGPGQLAAHVRLVSEEFHRVDRAPVDFGVLHHVRMAVGRGLPVLGPVGAHGHTHPVHNGRDIVLLLDIRVLQKRSDTHNI